MISNIKKTINTHDANIGDFSKKICIIIRPKIIRATHSNNSIDIVKK